MSSSAHRVPVRWMGCIAEQLHARSPFHEPCVDVGTELHPAFGNCYDWHSSVHMHWSGLRLLAGGEDSPEAHRAREVIASHLTSDDLAAEAGFLAERPLYERPYGRAWGLMLVAEMTRSPLDFLRGVDVSALQTELTSSLATWCTTMVAPERCGMHRNTAFSMVLTRHAAGLLGEGALVEIVDDTARRLFLADYGAPVHLEPSGEDFLSPSLTEAHLMAAILNADTFVEWLDRWLPASLPEPLDVPATADARIVHLYGLNLSRACNMDAIAAALPAGDARGGRLRDAAELHRQHGLSHVVRGDVASDHWLVTYGLLATEGLA